MRKFVLGALSFAAMAFASPASAAIYLFELLGDHEASFLLDSSPSPLPGDVFDGSFGLRDVAAELEGSPVQLFGLVFYASSGEGGFDLYLPTGDVAELAGPQLYTGDDSADIPARDIRARPARQRRHPPAHHLGHGRRPRAGRMGVDDRRLRSRRVRGPATARALDLRGADLACGRLI